MIISCPNCNKKFNIDEKLIPAEGRLLQCSICNHKWHYTNLKKENEIIKSEKILTTADKNISNNILPKDEKIKKKESKTAIKTYKKINNINQNLNKKNIEKKYSLGDILNYLLIIIITFVAFILILDTFKIYISNYFPILIPMLDNLYQSLSDIFSIIKDLLN